MAPFSLLLMIILLSYGLLLLNKYTRLAKTMIGLALITLYALSTTYGANLVIKPLEFQYDHFKQPDSPLQYIVVLGCAHHLEKHLPPSSLLHRCSQVRLHEALLLYRNNPEAKVIFTGGGWTDQPMTLAQDLANTGANMGINKENHILEQRPFNTEEEALYVTPVIRNKSAALVTSAAHMPRAMFLFNQQGANPIAAPTDYLTRYKAQKIKLRYFIPEVSNLQKVNSAAHEYYGFWWLQLKQWL